MAGFAGLIAPAYCFTCLLTPLVYPILLTEKIFYEFALPGDPFLDAFSSGYEPTDQYFRSRQWFNREKGKASPPTYVFRTAEEGATIGYCAVAFKNQKHPSNTSASKAKYLVIYMLGVDKNFHGLKNALAPEETYAASIMAILEEEMAKPKKDCVGLSLWVRSTNSRAIVFYSKVGFKVDPVDPDSGEPMLTMRKLLA